MTFLSPIPLPDPVEPAAWRAYVSHRARSFFDAHARDDAFEAVCFMLVKKPETLPVIAVCDEYDDVESIVRQMAHVVENFDHFGMHAVENTAGYVVLAWPFVSVDDEHRDVVFDLLRGVARDLGATATAIISECFMRTDFSAPRGTGSDVLMTCCEQAGRAVAVSIAEIEGAMPTRSLKAWTPLEGVAMGGAIFGLFNDADDTMPVPPGFTPKINVATVGEA